jgi:hypothetical protein
MNKRPSRDELLDEAILKAKGAENWQLAEWLRAARGSDESARWFTTKIADLKAENERLRGELERARDPQRIRGQADPESFVYAIEQLREFRWQHATNDEDAIPYINKVAEAHERETKRLREEMKDLEGYDQSLRDTLRQESELRVKTRDDNAKLREIARELYEDQCFYDDRWKYQGRLRELGVLDGDD